MSEGSSLLIEQNAPISISQWEEVIRSIIMFSEKIWLHYSSVEFARFNEIAIDRHIMLTFNELVEEGLIQFYGFDSDNDYEKKKSNRIITKEEHLTLYYAIIEKLQNPGALSIDTLPDPERTSRIIEKRNELWKYGLSTILDSDISALYKNLTITNLHSEIANRSLNPKLTSEVFSTFEISSLSHLSAKDIIDFRKKAEKHRKVFTNLVSTANSNQSFSTEMLVENEFKKSIEHINELAVDAAGNGAIKKLIASTTLNLVGLIPLSFIVVVPITAILCGKDLFEFIASRKKYGFVLFMNSLKAKSLKVKQSSK